MWVGTTDVVDTGIFTRLFTRVIGVRSCRFINEIFQQAESALVFFVFTIQYNITLLSLSREICFLARHLHKKNIQYS